jgi:D-threo-aldose 1-dehydrogenase
MQGAYRALDRLRQEGIIRAIGVGLNESEMCVRFAEAGDFDCALLAGRYSLLQQDALDRFLPLAARRGMGVILGGVFNSGILATGARPDARFNYALAPPEIMERVAQIERVCAAHGVPLAVAALQFALAGPAVASVILGGVTPEEVERNAAALLHPIPLGLWSDLKSEGFLTSTVPTPI